MQIIVVFFFCWDVGFRFLTNQVSTRNEGGEKVDEWSFVADRVYSFLFVHIVTLLSSYYEGIITL